MHLQFDILLKFRDGHAPVIHRCEFDRLNPVPLAAFQAYESVLADVMCNGIERDEATGQPVAPLTPDQMRVETEGAHRHTAALADLFDACCKRVLTVENGKPWADAIERPIADVSFAVKTEAATRVLKAFAAEGKEPGQPSTTT